LSDEDALPIDGLADGGLPVDSPDHGAPDEAARPAAYLIVARVLRGHGLNGEISCEIITEFPERFQKTKRVFLSPPVNPGSMEPLAGAAPQPMTIIRARLAPHRGQAEIILQLADVNDRDAADKLRGWLVQIPEREAWKLPRGRFYWHQILGLRVVTSEGEEIGTVAEILETGANDVYVVKGKGPERLIPAIKQVVQEIAPERGEMVVTLLPGM